MEAINEEFKELLEKSGWNQSRAAKELDLQPPSISRYVNGKDKPSVQTIRLFKALLNFEQVMPAGIRHGLLTDIPDLANLDDLLQAVADAQEALQTVKRHAERLKKGTGSDTATIREGSFKKQTTVSPVSSGEESLAVKILKKGPPSSR